MSLLNPDNDILDNLLPRRYQEEVFVRAQKGNIIAALNTGSGKTLISLLLIRWISTLQASEGKAIIFLVPKVPLVEQQGDSITRYTPLKVLKLHGGLDIDLTDRPGWRKRFSQYDVFVMTAQIFLNLLTHSLWSIDKVSLMVFDECHHTRKNHPYNGIMREYSYVVSPACRPKIFGMTASPIWNPKDAAGSLATLEANMDSKVIGVRAHVEELTEHSPKPVEIIKEFPHPLEEYDYPSPTLWMCLKMFDTSVWSELDIPWYNIDMRYHATMSNLGPYAASLFLFDEMTQQINRIFKLYQEASQPMEYDTEVSLPLSTSPKTPPAAFKEIREIHADFEEFFLDTSNSDGIPLSIPMNWCTPKVESLVDILLAHYTPAFQGIVFVEQRQVAACLARILPALPKLKGVIRSASLVGQGVGSDGVVKSSVGGCRDAVELFRKNKINLLIATSVAEEGLDFPACDLVVRFDSLHHMVGYVQSRGRARNKASTFVVMIQKDDTAHLSLYKTLQEVEPQVNRAYQWRHSTDKDEDEGEVDDEEDETNPVDLAERERYVVESSGAILTYDNSIQLLQYLCALIPRDAYTPPHLPKFTGDFEMTLHLPPSIPLPPEHLTFVGPPRHSKREAKRAVAFLAVKRLRELDVFDQYLLPAGGSKGNDTEDIDGRALMDVKHIPFFMDVVVRDPWTNGPRLWVHTVYINGRPVAALITGSMFPYVDLTCEAMLVHTDPGTLMVFENDEDESQKRGIMLEYTKHGIWYRITGRPLALPPSLSLVPLTKNNEPDFDAMKRLVASPHGYSDWTHIDERDYGTLMIMNDNEFGRPLILRNIRHDLTPMSVPAPGSREAGYPTYYDYYMHRWTRKKREARVPTEGPLVETVLLSRSFDGKYDLRSPLQDDSADTPPTVPNGSVVPRDCCHWIAMSPSIYRAYEVLPALCHRLTDIYRARQARIELALPPIKDDLLVEALTLPSANAGFSNQRMETLGDAVLELCTTVHLFNKYPHRHEGQLSSLRQSVISNRYLLARAKEVELEVFLTSEPQSVQTWRYVETVEKSRDFRAGRSTSRSYARRSLQDCMEATLGASFVTGGIPMALHTGEALGLAFGGMMPWSLRYSRNPVALPAPKLFLALEESLGYTFHRSELLLEAVTHPSFALASNSLSYQRLEFLGDALLDLVVVKYLYDKFPGATSHELALPKTKAICAPALASLAVRRLGLHKVLLANCVDLTNAINGYVPILQATSGEEIVKHGWRYDPPKAISDVFESVMGAVLVDSAYNYEKAAAVVEFVMEDVLMALSPAVCKDPVSELITWASASGCAKVVIKRRKVLCDGIERDSTVVLVHDVVISGPIVSTSLSVAKFAAAEKALVILKDIHAEKSLTRLCRCSVDSQPELVVQPPENNGGGSGCAISETLGFNGDISDFEDIDAVAVILTADDELAR